MPQLTRQVHSYSCLHMKYCDMFCSNNKLKFTSALIVIESILKCWQPQDEPKEDSGSSTSSSGSASNYAAGTGTLGRGMGKSDMFAEMELKLRERRAKAEGLPAVSSA